MKLKSIFFILLYMAVPGLIFLASYKANNWFGLFGTLFYFIGLLVAKLRQSILLPIPIIFCLWYWYTYGFAIRDVVSIYFFCLMLGYVLFRSKIEYDKFVKKVLPEKQLNEDYDEKLKKLEFKVEEFRRLHPNERITQDVIDTFKTDIFF